MKLIREITTTENYKGKYFFNVYISEYKTVYRITSKIIGYAMLCSENWKYSKKEYKTLDDAIQAHIKEVVSVWRL